MKSVKAFVRIFLFIFLMFSEILRSMIDSKLIIIVSHVFIIFIRLLSLLNWYISLSFNIFRTKFIYFRAFFRYWFSCKTLALIKIQLLIVYIFSFTLLFFTWVKFVFLFIFTFSYSESIFIMLSPILTRTYIWWVRLRLLFLLFIIFLLRLTLALLVLPISKCLSSLWVFPSS